MQDAQSIARIRRKYQSLLPEMDERRRRQWAAAEARELGWGGVSLVARATGLSRPTIMAGLRELDQPSHNARHRRARVRRPGGGRRPLTETDPGVAAGAGGAGRTRDAWRSRVAAALDLQEHATLGRGTDAAGPSRGRTDRGPLLHEAGYSLQANRKTREGIVASGPQRPVRVHQRQRRSVPEP